TSLLREHPERLRLPFQRRLRLLSGCLGAGLPRVEKLAVEELRLEGRQVELARRPIDQRRALGGGVLGEALQDPLEGALDVGLARVTSWPETTTRNPWGRPTVSRTAAITGRIEAETRPRGIPAVWIWRGTAGTPGSGRPSSRISATRWLVLAATSSAVVGARPKRIRRAPKSSVSVA